jgi:hypothetical protein
LAYAEIQDLKELPQNAVAYTASIDDNRSLFEIQSTFKNRYFSAWHMKLPNYSKESYHSPFREFTPQNSFGDNLQPITQQFLDQLEKNTNPQEYGKINSKAITTIQVSLRTLPTDKPFFNDPRKSGEGFPFDYLQESTIHFNEPILVSHYSADGAWAFVHTSYASGWIHSNAMVFLSEIQCEEFENEQKISITSDDIPLKDDKNQFLHFSKIGMQLPVLSETKTDYVVSVIVGDIEHNAIYKRMIVPKSIATSTVLTLNQQNINSVVDAIMHAHYGWGGMYGERDCSSTLKDLFTPFGIWLPRNSTYQAKIGKVISLNGLSDNDKIERIKKDGVPFETLLHKKGHILLYAGVFHDKVVVLHNIWGIKTAEGDKTGRLIIGHTVFSTLEIGKEQKYYASSLLGKLDSMNIITARP